MRHALLGTLPGRALLVGLGLRVVVAVARGLGAGESWIFDLVDRVGAISLVIGGGYFLYRLFALARHRLLWRVRRKLILSYVFIGVVPALLIVAFFVLCGLLLFFHISSYLVQSRLRSLTEQAQFQAKTAAMEIQRTGGVAAAESILARRQANLELQYQGASFALVPMPPRGCAGSRIASPSTEQAAKTTPISVGPWPHLDPPIVLPDWVSCSGFGGLIAYMPAGSENPVAPPRASRGLDRAGKPRDPNPNLEPQATDLAIRASALPDGSSPAFAVILDLPVNESIAERLRDETGIHLGRVSVVPAAEDEVRPAIGRPLASSVRAPEKRAAVRESLNWVTLLDYTDWKTGKTAPVTWAIDLNISQVYDRLSSTQARIRNRSFGQILLVLLAIIAALFLIIEFVALVMGLALAKSITGSVHALFTGTERVRQGDFAHRIKVEARDQLGELAEQFNSMTGRLEGLMAEAAEKKRLEEELRIAREIQMSLLPQGRLSVPGLSVTALCEPAREVGGDYYDFFALDEDRLAVLIADVSGKGTSAAFYMAELKGLMLSLSQICRSPRELLIRANRIIAEHLPSRSFITMIYAVLDLRAGTMTYARAGHTPLIHLPADGAARRAKVLAPDGMVLGLKLDNGEMFEQMLEEAIIPLRIGDLFLFFTDGISEAMNEDADCFDESRLCRLVEEHGHLPTDELRERILREVHGFVGGAPKHDDLTMILLRVEELPAAKESVWVGVDGALDG